MISFFGWELSVRINLRKKIAPLLIEEKIKDKVLKSYSQFHEDLIIYQILCGNNKGFYIDIGANHPIIFNNTKKLYDIGWSGINIEPNPKLHKLFCEFRPNDINLNCGVGDTNSEMVFYEFSPDVYSTFDKKSAMKAKYSKNKKIISEITIKIMTINEVFSLHRGRIDFLSVDTEGFDYKILSGNNWETNRPAVIMVELNHDTNNNIFNLLTKKNYHLVFYNFTNGIFVSDDFVSSL